MTTIRVALAKDADTCVTIFAHYAQNTLANLREQPLPLSYFADLINKANDDAPFLVAVDEDAVIGYAYCDMWRTRCGYEYTTELSIYVEKSYLAKGVGKQLMQAILAQLQKGKMQTVVSFLTMPNDVSVRLHENFGFVASGVLQSVGYKFNKNHDVGIWVKHLRPAK